MSPRDVTIAQRENGASKCEWRHAPGARGGFWEFQKSQLVELSCDLPREKTVDFRLLAEALGRCRTRWRGWGRWKSQNRKNVHFSPYVEEPLNSKVIKSFVPELWSRKCFSCFEIPMFDVIYLWTFYVHFTHSRIWLWYIYGNKWRSSLRVCPGHFYAKTTEVNFGMKTLINHLWHRLWEVDFGGHLMSPEVKQLNH